MGRNDISRLGNLYLLGLRGIIACFLIAGFFAYALPTVATADDQQDRTSCIVTVTYPVGTFSYIRVTENTAVKRIFSDSSFIVYNREVQYYLTRFVKSPAEDGFQTVSVTVDSIHYKYNDNKDTVVVTNDEQMGINADGMNYFCLSGKSFDITYSPYGEIAKISGEDLDWMRDYIEQGKNTGMSDDKYFNWTECMSDSRIAYIADERKIIIPQGIIPTDTVWTSNIAFQGDNKKFNDSLSVKIVNIDRNEYNISTISLGLTNIKQNYKYNGIRDFGNIEQSNGFGSFSMDLTKRGRIKSSILDYYISTKNTKANSVFNELIHTRTTWELIDIVK